MSELMVSLGDLVFAVWGLLKVTCGLLLPWFPLVLWIGFWLFAVNWTKLFDVLFSKGGVLGLALLTAIIVLIWGIVAPPETGSHHILGLTLTNTFVGKFVYVTGLICIAWLCGSLQLSGCCNQWCEVTMPDPHAHGGHDHDGDSHGHGNHASADHGHASH